MIAINNYYEYCQSVLLDLKKKILSYFSVKDKQYETWLKRLIVLQGKPSLLSLLNTDELKFINIKIQIMTSKRSPFIDAFREPTLTKNSFLLLADVRGDGQGKLVIWQQQQSKIIVYKGSNRQYEKVIKLKNVSGIIQFQDQQRNTEAVIGMSAENCFYIFRGLVESYRLRIPDVLAQMEEQMIWTQFQKDPQKLGDQLRKLSSHTISQTGKYYLGSNSIQRKKQIINQVFTEGINQKDSISSLTLLKNNDNNRMGNIVIGTELNRLYILDQYGHSIVHQKILPFTPSIILSYGSFHDKYVLVCIGRDCQLCVYLQKDFEKPSQQLRTNSRVISASFSFPDFIYVSADQIVTHSIMSNSNLQLMGKKYSMKLSLQPIKVQFVKIKNQKMTFMVFESEFRIYSQKELHYTFYTQYKLYNVICGSFVRQDFCAIMMYEGAGFQVLILHRQFSVKQKYGANLKNKKVEELIDIPIQKKSSHFLTFWNGDHDQKVPYKLFQKSLDLLKWHTLKQKFTQKSFKSQSNIEINSKILGLGPVFILSLQIQNLSDEPFYQVDLFYNYAPQAIEIIEGPKVITMLAPLTLMNYEIRVRNLSCKNQTLKIQINLGQKVVSSTIYIPNCEMFGQGL